MTGEEIVARIKKALARDGSHTFEDVVERIQTGQADIFHNEHGCWITEIMNSPRSRWLHVWVVAGELPGIMDLQDQVIEFARENGCQHLTTVARLGWTKSVGPAHGWKTHAVHMLHEL